MVTTCVWKNNDGVWTDECGNQQIERGVWANHKGDPIETPSHIRYFYGKSLDNRGLLDQTPVRGIPAIRSDKPHVSEAAAIHVDQVDQFNKVCSKGTHYDKGTGELVSTSSQSREREVRRRGLSFN